MQAYPNHQPSSPVIRVQGARQNNLKDITVEIPLNKITVVTGVSGSGKSSLVFDTVYAEGQRRYIETFSAYMRQFLDRMDKPQARRIEGIPPAVAIEAANPVRTSRSTVGTMTEINDYLKLLYSKLAHLYCRSCGKQVQKDNPESILQFLRQETRGKPTPLVITFSVPLSSGVTPSSMKEILASQGYTRFFSESAESIEVIQDRFLLNPETEGRAREAMETALRYGKGRLTVYPLAGDRSTPTAAWKFSEELHCAECDIHYREPAPHFFSFNSPLGACPRCRGFGRIIDVDFDRVIPDASQTLREGAIKPWQTASYAECQEDLESFAGKRGIPLDVPWKDLTETQRNWVIDGEGSWEEGKWYGVRRFFQWLESRTYKMHIRVLLSRYRDYVVCPTCGGSRLQEEALLWRLGGPKTEGGLNIHELSSLSIHATRDFLSRLSLTKEEELTCGPILTQVLNRLTYLVHVGLDYLTLDRQSRTLSGGELQRINLTTALGSSLVNTLFVLDEPSIGLHSRDIDRLIQILRMLRDNGNTLLIVEHDPQVIKAADYVIDMGPGPGERGGKVIFAGPKEDLLRSPSSLTAQYLRGEKQSRLKPDLERFSDRKIKTSALPRRESANGGPPEFLHIEGATVHNLRNLSLTIPLRKLVVLSGVSGSGKSTLLEEVLFPNLSKLVENKESTLRNLKSVRGFEGIDRVVFVDQKPIGKSSRSNPVSYIGAFDGIRKLFASLPLAKERGYTAGTFSFNSGNGRCPVCEGKGYERVEMQFLSDVYIRCAECEGKRYKPEVREVLYTAKDDRFFSISDVLDLTVAEAMEVFQDHGEILSRLSILGEVGLSYLRLGQGVPTLSGGEAQRLKLAGHLAEAEWKRGAHILFLLDEPTTGLHFDDIATLLRVFRRIVEAGHSLFVIEHNLDVIASADHIIDLGPEGGEKGGQVVAQGPLDRILSAPQSWTGRSLNTYLKKADQSAWFEMAAETSPPFSAAPAKTEEQKILVRNAKEHNLKRITVACPLNSFTVLTGVSGSGKSTLAFNIIFAEGQRRYLETLNAYARQFAEVLRRPDVEEVSGVPPTVSIEQHTSRGGRKSTVATVTEIYHYLRLWFTKLGTYHCPDCRIPIKPQTPESITEAILQQGMDAEGKIYVPLVVNRKGLYKELAAWARKQGYSHLRVDGELRPTDPWPTLSRYKEHTIDLPLPLDHSLPQKERVLEAVRKGLQIGKGLVKVSHAEGGREEEVLYSTLRTCPSCGRSFPEPDPRLFSFNSKHGWCPQCYGTGLLLRGFDEEQTGEEIWWNEWYEGEEVPCPSCEGKRLRPEALAVTFQGQSIADITALSVKEARDFFSRVSLHGRDLEIGKEILPELVSRLSFLEEVGLSYLPLNRSAPSLSGGESRRVRLAAQLGSNLRGVCYILDEPTIGLHSRDNDQLIQTLKKLKDKGNTLIVVEHDEQTIRESDHVIDLGPGGGSQGGEVLAEGTPAQVASNPRSVTGLYLSRPLPHPFNATRRVVFPTTPRLWVRGASLHNLKGIDVGFPLKRFVVVTGVSGSGKSTLVRDILHASLARLLKKEGSPSRAHKGALVGCSSLEGWEPIQRLLEVDQTPIGRTPRSCPATYVGCWDPIRKLFAELPDSRMRGFSPSRFSFNVPGGRCPECEGQGVKRVEMSFLPDAEAPCEACEGKRFEPETRGIRFKGMSIADVLDMRVDEAVEFFSSQPAIHHTLRLMQEVGLGYLSLGQPSPTLSGGESQRLKLVTELSKIGKTNHRKSNPSPHTLYILDEPTIGLHAADIKALLSVLHRIVDAGHSLIVIEHNLDLIAEADWIIDLGPEGGSEGGRIVGEGPPEALSLNPASHTGAYLRDKLPYGRAPLPPLPSIPAEVGSAGDNW